MRTREDIVAAARRWDRTPFQHQARCFGVGVDCIGLCEMALREAGLLDEALPTDYERQATDDRLHVELAKRFDPIPIGSELPGDILSIAFVREIPQHMAIRTEKGIIHTWSGAGLVSEHALTRAWKNRQVGAWRARGIVEAA